MEELNCKTAFEIPVLGGIPVAESVVVTWIIMAVMVILALLLVRDLRIENVSRKQLFLEAAVGFFQKFFMGILGENGKRYVPYMITVTLFIGFANIVGIFGFVPPTKDLNVTAGLAIMSILLVEIAGIQQRGMKGWLKSFAEPTPVMLPINIMEIAIRPTSLCMRLFGNILGGFIIMELIEIVVPVIVPAFFSLYFDFFDGFIQTYVFVFLTSLFISEAIETE